MQGIELTPERPIGELVGLATLAEDRGFDAAFTSCHYNNRDPFMALAQLASATTSIRLGPGVANPYETHPVSLTGTVATLSELSDGRAIFGLGAGDRSTLSNLGIDRDRPLRRVLETMQVARRLFAGERVTHEGTFQCTDAGLNFDAETPAIYVGAQGPDMLRMSAKHADGVLINAAHPRDVAWARERVEEGLQERPANRDELDIVAYAAMSVAEDREAARAAARPPVAFIAGGADPAVLDRHGLEPERAARLAALIGEGAFREAFDAVTPPMLEAFCIAGTPAEVGDRVGALLENVDGVVAAAPLGPDEVIAIDLLADVFDTVC